MRTRCLLCGSKELKKMVALRNVPALSNVLWHDREAAMSARRGDIDLTFCSECGIIFNAAFDPALIEYDREYENSLHCSGEFNRYCERLASELCDRHKLKGKTVLEIGCGQGIFLSMVQRIGNNIAVGYDPSYRGEDKEDSQINSKMKIYASEYPPAAGCSEDPDFLCCRHVLEHIPEPVSFVEAILNSDQQPDSLYFEVPNALHILRTSGAWDLLYEHCTYYTPQALRKLFTMAGFGSICIKEHFHGQFLAVEASHARTFGQQQSCASSAKIGELVGDFCNDMVAKIGRWREYMDSFLSSGKRTAVWGAGAKGIMFLNTLSLEYNQVPYIVDINPVKQGQFLTGTGQKIIKPDELLYYKPDVVIIMNGAYAGEIGESLKRLGLNKTEVLTA